LSESQSSEVGPGDYQDLALYLSRAWQAGSVSYWNDRLVTWWDRNPACRETWVRGYLLRNDSGIVGFIGNIPYLMQIDHREAVVVVSTSWIIDPEYRTGSGGLDLLLKQVEFAQSTILLTDTASKNTARIMDRLRFSRLPAQSDRQSFFLANPNDVLAARLVPKGVPRFCISGLGLLYRVIQGVRLFKPGRPKLETQTLSLAGSEFDELWARTRGRYATTAVRTKAQVNWYCFSSESLRKVLLGAYDSSHQLVGYMILAPRVSYSYRILECLDYWEDGSQLNCAASLVDYARRLCGSHGFAALQLNQIKGPLEDALQDSGLFWRQAGGGHVLYLCGDEDLCDPFTENCFMSEVVGDRGL